MSRRIQSITRKAAATLTSAATRLNSLRGNPRITRPRSTASPPIPRSSTMTAAHLAARCIHLPTIESRARRRGAHGIDARVRAARQISRVIRSFWNDPDICEEETDKQGQRRRCDRPGTTGSSSSSRTRTCRCASNNTRPLAAVTATRKRRSAHNSWVWGHQGRYTGRGQTPRRTRTAVVRPWLLPKLLRAGMHLLRAWVRPVSCTSRSLLITKACLGRPRARATAHRQYDTLSPLQLFSNMSSSNISRTSTLKA